MFAIKSSQVCLRPCRYVSSKPVDNLVSEVFTNRNPRNLERMTIGYKPDGYHLEKPGKRFWHKLALIPSGKHLTASVLHYQHGEVLSASTKEWAIQKQLFKTTDTAAYINIARVLAQRCLESGLIEIRCDIEVPTQEGKVAMFLKTLKENGIKLEEPPQYKHPRPSDPHRPEKPWHILE